MADRNRVRSDSSLVGNEVAPIERRRTLRRRLHIHVSVRPDGPHKPQTGRVTNISVAGAFIALADPVPQGTPVQLAFLLPDHTEVHGHGVVMWSETEGEELGIGVKLKNLSTESLERLYEAVEFLR